MPFGCIRLTVVIPQIPVEYVLYGTQEIDWINGAKNGLFPSRLRLAESGGLSSSQGSAGEDATLEGSTELIGANAVELLTAR